MGSDYASENNPDDHSCRDETNSRIPSPRAPLDDTINNSIDTTGNTVGDTVGNPPEVGSDDPVWWYDQPRKRGGDRRYWGQVERIGGAEGDQLRRDIAAALWDLLAWATQAENSDKDSEADSGEEGEADDRRA
jgi:hypothetical protein